MEITTKFLHILDKQIIILNINNKEGQSNLSSINNLNNNVKLVENTMTNNT